MKIKSFLSVVMLWIAMQVAAADYMFKHIEVKDGLSNNLVTQIFKDSRGYMWIGTGAGLNRYDGNEIITYRSYDDNGPLLNNYITDIQEDCFGRLWIGTSGGYSVYNPETESFEREIRGLMWEMGINGTPSLVYIDKNRSMWFYLKGNGVYQMVPQNNLLFPLLFEADGLPEGDVKDIAECSDGILLAYSDGRLFCIDRESNKIKWEEKHIASKGVEETYSLYVDRDDDIWMFSPTVAGVYQVMGRKWNTNWIRKVLDSSSDMVQSVIQAKNGLVWIGRNRNGICVLDKSNGKTEVLAHVDGDERSLQNNSVMSLFEDANGVMWVGTYKKGVSYYSESIFKFGINPIGDVNCVEEDDGNHLWIGTNDEGLYRLNRKTRKLESFRNGGANSISSNVIVALKHTRDDKLWIGTFRGGLNCYDGQRFTHYRHIPGNPNSLSNDNVYSIDEDEEGNLWIGTLGGGVQCLNPKTGKFLTFTEADGLASDHILSVQVGKNRQLIVATANGLTIFDMESHKGTVYHGTKSGQGDFSDLGLNQAFQDSRGLLWLATRNGLDVFDVKADKLVVLTEKDGLSNQLITGIAEDDNHNIWVATAKGLTNIVPSVDARTGQYTFQCDTYSDRDGLQSCEFNMRTLKKVSSGELMVGGMYGVNYFHPEKIHFNTALPNVHFTRLNLFNEEVQIGKMYGEKVILDKTLNAMEKIELAYNQNVFSVQFASDNFVLPEKTKFAYKLEGFNSDWLTTDVGKVTYTNLSSGTYTLKVKAINSDGFSGDKVASLRIEIQPPFWLSKWAYVLYAILLVAVLFLARYLMLRSERNKFRISEMQRETDKMKEVNDLKLHFFTNVSHELRTPLTLILSPLEVLMKEHSNDNELLGKLQMMHRNASRLLNLVNQLLDFRKGDEKGHRLELIEGDIVSYTSNICHTFTSMTEKKNVHLTFSSGLSSLNMSFDGDKYNKIVVNLLSNAFKFTPEGGRVDLSMYKVKDEAGNDMLELKIADTGTGIKDEDKLHIFERFYQVDNLDADVTGTGVGLCLVDEFVKLHGGTVEVQDNKPVGSIFIVRLPINRSGVATREQGKRKAQEGEGELIVIRHKHTMNRTEAVYGDPDIGTTQPEPQQPVVVKKIHPKKEDTSLPMILVADDNEDFLNFMAESFSKNYRIRIAHNGRQAWEMLQEMVPDVIISDVMMPEMDGNQLCKLVKADKRTSHIPFILLTSYLSNEYKMEGLTVGADEYITKPFNVELLNLRIKKLISLHQSAAKQHAMIDPTPSEIEITSVDEKLIEQAVKYVEDNIARSELSVEELSRALGMSRVHLYKKLVAITGKTPIEFIRVIRLKRAAQLLRQGQQNVSEVAYQVGFNNPKYFSKYFRDEFGVLPSVYQSGNVDSL